MNHKRIVLIGDVHGTLIEFKQLLEKINYNKTEDRILCLGDALNRGPHSIETLDYIMENQFECILGNHEWKYLQYYNLYQKQKENPEYTEKLRPLPEIRRKLFNSLSVEHFNFIQSMPLYIQFDTDWIAVHAGFHPYKKLEENNILDLTSIRYINKTTKEHFDTYGLKQIPKNVAFWTEEYQGDFNVIYGHNVFWFDSEEIRITKNNKITVGVDCGNCFGGSLCCMIFNPQTKEYYFEKVKANKVYYKSKYYGNK